MILPTCLSGVRPEHAGQQAEVADGGVQPERLGVLGQDDGIRSWMGATSALGEVVMMVHDWMGRPSGLRNSSHSPANANGSPVLSVMRVTCPQRLYRPLCWVGTAGNAVERQEDCRCLIEHR